VDTPMAPLAVACKNLTPGLPESKCLRDCRPQRGCSEGHFVPLIERPGASNDTRPGSPRTRFPDLVQFLQAQRIPPFRILHS
jgi:hypothetical protein